MTRGTKSGLFHLFHLWGWITDAFVVTRSLSQRSLQQNAFMPKQQEGESEKQFFQRITQAASDPQSFENMVLGGEQAEKQTMRIRNNDTPSKTGASEEEAPRRRYVPPEEWEAAQRNSTQGNLSWEERVQFEGQRNGNRYRQNEILRHNLKGF